MMGRQIDFHSINQAALNACPGLVSDWFINGVIEGREFCVGSIAGEPGHSLKINLNTGIWCDFAEPGNSGGDLIALFAKINALDQRRAAQQLAKHLGISDSRIEFTTARAIALKANRPPKPAQPREEVTGHRRSHHRKLTPSMPARA